MKKLIAMLFSVTGMVAAATSTMASEPAYIPWTFDDFNSNCEVIETAAVQPVEFTTVSVEIADDEEAGELGW